MSLRISIAYPADDGAGGLISGGSGLATLLDLDTGYYLDASDLTWKATPASGGHALAEDAHLAGYYDLDLATTTWGNRHIQIDARLYKAGYSPWARTWEEVVLNGAGATPVYTPTPASGAVSVIFYVRTSAGAVPSSQPSSTPYLEICQSAANPHAQGTRTAGAWDGTYGAWSWSVPENTTIFKVSVPDCDFMGYYASVTSNIIINTATPLRRL